MLTCICPDIFFLSNVACKIRGFMNIDLKLHRFKAKGWNNEQNFGNNK